MFDRKHIFNTEFVEAHNEPIVGGGLIHWYLFLRTLLLKCDPFSFSFFLCINVLANEELTIGSDYYYH